MANYKSKRSTRSSQRGRGKNHSVNRERSREEQKAHRVAKLRQEIKNDRQRRYNLAVSLYMHGICDDLTTAREKAFAVSSNFFVDGTKQWF